jgi:glycerol-3-phosphate dehydrogenase
MTVLPQPLPFVMPFYQWWEAAFYGVGLKAYDLLAGMAGLGQAVLVDGFLALARRYIS